MPSFEKLGQTGAYWAKDFLEDFMSSSLRFHAVWGIIWMLQRRGLLRDGTRIDLLGQTLPKGQRYLV